MHKQFKLYELHVIQLDSKQSNSINNFCKTCRILIDKLFILVAFTVIITITLQEHIQLGRPRRLL